MDDIAQILKLALAAQKKISETRIEDYEPYDFQSDYHNGKDKNGEWARQKFLQAANQVGKTWCAASEVAFHATGDYPFWYEGHRLDNPTQIQVSGVTNETTRDICQVNYAGILKTLKRSAPGQFRNPRLLESPPASQVFQMLTIQ